jgi:hypothetical protein
MRKVDIPDEIFDPFFFSDKQIDLDVEDFTFFYANEPFIHEIAYYGGNDTVKPWEAIEKFLPDFYLAWEELHGEIKTLFDNRNNKDTVVPMKRGIGYLIELIFWTNGLPAQKKDQFDFETLNIKPVNIAERLQFLMRKPNIYPSFAQLNELMEEQKKQFSKYLALQKSGNINKK